MSIESILSKKAKTMWGKLAHDGSHNWLPLWIHLWDTAEIMSFLWDKWVPRHTKNVIISGMDKNIYAENNEEYTGKILRFLAGSHDIGKASPGFVIKAAKVGFSDIVDKISGMGFPMDVYSSSLSKGITHALISEYVLENNGVDRSLANIVGAHHGSPPDEINDIERVVEYPKISGVRDSSWRDVQRELLHFALELSGLKDIPNIKFSVPAQVLINALVIMADWLASDEQHFPMISWDFSTNAIVSSTDRAYHAWKEFGLPEFEVFSDACALECLYKERFGRNPRPVQVSALGMASEAEQPGIMVIEAPMGEGKTEAALAVAETWARNFGLSGIYFALPTQATSDGIFPRIAEWIKCLHSGHQRTIYLSHGKAGLNKEYTGIRLKTNIYDEDIENVNLGISGDVTVNTWTAGRKKGLLADFVVGTVDHVLMGGLKSKHLSLRHLGLANKVVIIDECHAYDAYMNQYLDLILDWLGAYKVPVILLSATLPPQRRKELLNAYRKSAVQKKRRLSLNEAVSMRKKHQTNQGCDEAVSEKKYPYISYVNATVDKINTPEPSGRNLIVNMEYIDDDLLADKLEDLLSDGGCAGIIRNTVKEAQETAQIMEMYFGEDKVRLLHSRFISLDRAQKEVEIRRLLGPGEDQRPEKLIVVGTQVMEQSLDVDFDVLFTDICPVDLLLQRIGRLHRHARKNARPQQLRVPRCFVTGVKGEIEFSEGTSAVYEKYLLLKTKALLTKEVMIPKDIPRLVEAVYEESTDESIIKQINSDSADKIFRQAKLDYITKIQNKKNRARDFQIKTPKAQKDNMIGWLEAKQKEDVSGKRGEATVRDSSSSLDVLIICRKTDGIYTVPWLNEYPDKKIEDVPDDMLAKSIAGCSVSLPSYFVAEWNIDKVIHELENDVIKYGLERLYMSYWLKGELFLVLDEKMEAKLLDKKMVYDERYGLWFYDGGE